MTTTDPDTPRAASGPRIIVISENGDPHPDAEAHIRAFSAELDVGEDTPGVIWHLPAGMQPPPGAVPCVAEGLATATALTASPQAPAIVPRADVRRVAQRFGFNPGVVASGFTTYQLDPASASAYEVLEDGRWVALSDWLTQAAALGFNEVWLHSPTAEAGRHGFARAMLAKAHRLAPDMRFWLSGGGATLAHFEAASGAPGLVALVVPAETAASFAPGELIVALEATAPETGRGVA